LDICEEVKVMKKFFNKVVYFLISRERGATAVEYALIVALIALAIVVGVTAVGGGLNTAFTNISTQIEGAFGG
jgi:pilus assembly protein Flp/PilA